MSMEDQLIPTDDAALVSLMKKTGYEMIQQNGQRKFGPPPNWGDRPPPPKGSEIFVGKLPRDCYEDELVPLFARIGRIYEMRLMMDFSGTNRGYAFVMYTCVDDAKRAVAQLNNYQVRPNKFLGVLKSVDNCRLFVGGIPKNQTRDEILEEMSKITDGVVGVILYNSPRDKTKNRGFAFIEYESHRAAAIARRKLIPGRIQLWGQTIMVDWAEPEPDVDEDVMSKVKVLYVRNLMESTSEELIKGVFSRNCDGSIEKVKKLRDFAFVHFAKREDAHDAMMQFNGSELDGSIIEVTWAKPADKSNNRSRRLMPMSSMQPFGGYGGMGDHVPGQMMQYATPTQVIIPSAGRGNYGGIRYRTRGRGAAGLRGARGGYFGAMGAGPSEFRLYDLPPGLHVMPTNTLPLRQPKLPHQVLADICQKNNWGEPQYQIQGSPSGPHGGGSGNEVQMFACKVNIPPIGTYSILPKLCRSMEDARQNAAQYVISALFSDSESKCNVSSDNSPATSASSSPISMYYDSENRDSNGRYDSNYDSGAAASVAANSRGIRAQSFDMSSFYDYLPGYPMAAAGNPHY